MLSSVKLTMTFETFQLELAAFLMALCLPLLAVKRSASLVKIEFCGGRELGGNKTCYLKKKYLFPMT